MTYLQLHEPQIILHHRGKLHLLVVLQQLGVHNALHQQMAPSNSEMLNIRGEQNQ